MFEFEFMKGLNSHVQNSSEEITGKIFLLPSIFGKIPSLLEQTAKLYSHSGISTCQHDSVWFFFSVSEPHSVQIVHSCTFWGISLEQREVCRSISRAPSPREKDYLSWAQRRQRSLLGHLLNCFLPPIHRWRSPFWSLPFIYVLCACLPRKKPPSRGKRSRPLAKAALESCARVKGSEPPRKKYSLFRHLLINGPVWAEQWDLFRCTLRYVGLRTNFSTLAPQNVNSIQIQFAPFENQQLFSAQC